MHDGRESQLRAREPVTEQRGRKVAAGRRHLLTALITPCDPASGKVDMAAVGPLVEYQARHGVDGLFVLGTAGQGPLLSGTERKAVLRKVLGSAAERLSVICHVGAVTTAASVELARDAAGCGAAGVAAVPPVYYSPDEETVDQYYHALLGAVDIPVYAYDNPKATGYQFTVPQLARLTRRGLAGVKVARSDVVYLQQLQAAGVPFWTANADLNAAGFCAGARGAISTITNLAPGLFVALREAVLSVDFTAARLLQARVSSFAVRVRQPIIGGLHYGAALLGLPAGAPRRPLRMPDGREQAAIAAALRAEDLLE